MCIDAHICIIEILMIICIDFHYESQFFYFRSQRLGEYSTQGCLSFMCCAIDPSVPYDLPHLSTGQINLLSIQLAHLLFLLFRSSMEFIRLLPYNPAMRSARRRLSSMNVLSCAVNKLLAIWSCSTFFWKQSEACSGDEKLDRSIGAIVDSTMSLCIILVYIIWADLILKYIYRGLTRMTKPLQAIQSYHPTLLLLDADGPYLINTTKVIRGHKLRLKSYVKVQMLKSAHLSPSKYEWIAPQQKHTEPPLIKCGGYAQKYQWREIENEQEMAKQVQRMREKNSRSSKERMKLFTDSRKLRKDKGKQSVKTELMISRNAPQSRSSYQSAKTEHNLHSNMVNLVSSSLPPKHTPSVQFVSANLGRRMNEYLNIVLAKRQAEEKIETTMQTIKFQEYEKKISTPIHHKRNSNFIRKMKISQRGKLFESSSSASPSKILQQGELVKSVLRKTPREQLSADISMSDWKGEHLNLKSRPSSKGGSALPTYRSPPLQPKTR